MSNLFYEARYRCNDCDKLSVLKRASNPRLPLEKGCSHCSSSKTRKVYEKFYPSRRCAANGSLAALTATEARYRKYFKSAGMRSFAFELSYNEFERIVKDKCHYCRTSADKVVMGVDRKDNKVGYVIGNCLPACKWCNMAKGKMSYTAFLNQSNKRNGV